MKHTLIASRLVLFWMVALFPNVGAATVINAYSEAMNVGHLHTDSSTATTGTVFAQAVSLFGGSLSSASASIDGHLAVSAGGAPLDYWSGYGEASWSDTFTNTGSVPVRYQLNFTTGGGYLHSGGDERIADFRSSLDVSILLDGLTIWRSNVALQPHYSYAEGSYLNTTYVSLSGTDLGGQLFLDSEYGCSAEYFQNPFSDSLDLGMLTNGKSFTLEYLVRAWASGQEYGGIWVNGGFSGQVTQAPVPEPGTMMLLGSGLVGLIGYGRRRFKK